MVKFLYKIGPSIWQYLPESLSPGGENAVDDSYGQIENYKNQDRTNVEEHRSQSTMDSRYLSNICQPSFAQMTSRKTKFQTIRHNKNKSPKLP